MTISTHNKHASSLKALQAGSPPWCSLPQWTLHWRICPDFCSCVCCSAPCTAPLMSQQCLHKLGGWCSPVWWAQGKWKMNTNGELIKNKVGTIFCEIQCAPFPLKIKKNTWKFTCAHYMPKVEIFIEFSFIGCFKDLFLSCPITTINLSLLLFMILLIP